MELPEWEPMDDAALDAIESEALHQIRMKKRSRADTSWAPSACTTAPLTAPPETRRLPHWGTLYSREIPKARYPLFTFGGRIVYSRTALEVEKATSEFLKSIQAKKQTHDSISVGFDIEWKPTFKRGEGTRKAAVIQLCADVSHCYVMHIIHSGIPPTLEAFLKDDSFTKVGVSIGNDAIKVMKDYKVRVEALHELSELANLKLGGTPRNWSLCSLTETLTCKQLAKPKKIRLGNWEVKILSKEQLTYAATDAFASWYLYEALKNLPDASNDANAVKVS